ncbi:MAG: hypothetical protein LBV38_06380 [Alistipes sp.]|jgi:hypothetical protein|nr:hypothetical protein [Alistipes sp.]
MEKIKIGLLDMFAFIIPGAIVILMIYCFHNIEGGVLMVDWGALRQWNFSFLPAAALIVLSYVIGVTINTTAKGLWWALHRIFGEVDSEGSARHCRARELSPVNYRNIENLIVARELSLNLAIVVLAGGIAFFVGLDRHSFCCLMAGVSLSALLFAAVCMFGEMIDNDLDSIEQLER